MAEARNFPVQGFDRIEASSGLHVTVTPGEAASVVVDAPDPADLDKLIVEVRGNTLVLGQQHKWFDFSFAFGPRVEVKVTAPALRAIAVSSGADLTASGWSVPEFDLAASSGAHVAVSDIAANNVSANASSGGSIEAAGKCANLDADASSGGQLNASGLICNEVSVNASSGGSAEVHATDAITAGASSGGSVTVTGNPSKTQIQSSFGGSINIK